MENPNEKKYHKVDLADFANLVLQEINSENNKGESFGITKPFETIINPESINIESLKLYASLPIETIMLHDNVGNLILSTGSVGKSSYNFGETREDLIQKFTEIIRSGNTNTDEYRTVSSELRNFDEADRQQLLRKYNDQSFIAHQHPSGKNLPSIQDLMYLLSAKSEANIIFTNQGVVFYTATSEVIDKLVERLQKDKAIEMTPEQFDIFLNDFYKENKIILKVINFEDPKFTRVMDFMKGNISFSELLI